MLILYRLVRRWQGEVPALIAALVFALTPVVLLMFRYNNPDAFLTLLLLLATWAFWSALEKDSGWRLAVAGALVGFAFLTKMLEAFIVLPAFVVVYLICAKPRFWRRMLHLGGALIAMVVAGGWWVLLVELWPAASRPYIGGSTDNSVLDLILSRTAGYTSGSGTDGSGAVGLGGGGGGPDFAGSTGWLRMFNEQLGGQISWLLPLALLGLLAGLWVTRKGRRTDLKRAGYLLWGLWTVVMVLVFSFAEGVLHPYYSIVIGPGLAALVGAGSLALWRLGRDNRWFSWLLPGAVVGSAIWSARLLERTPDFAPGLEHRGAGAGRRGRSGDTGGPAVAPGTSSAGHSHRGSSRGHHGSGAARRSPRLRPQHHLAQRHRVARGRRPHHRRLALRSGRWTRSGCSTDPTPEAMPRPQPTPAWWPTLKPTKATRSTW